MTLDIKTIVRLAVLVLGLPVMGAELFLMFTQDALLGAVLFGATAITWLVTLDDSLPHRLEDMPTEDWSEVPSEELR